MQNKKEVEQKSILKVSFFIPTEIWTIKISEAEKSGSA